MSISKPLVRLMAMLAICAGVTLAHIAVSTDARADSLKVIDAHARMTIAGRPLAVYLKIVNVGAEADRLIRVSTPDAARAELHTHKMQDGIMRMRQVDAVAIPTNGSAELKSGGDHIMLFSPSEEVKPGVHLHLTLEFEKAGKINVMAVVGKPGDTGKMDHSNMNHSGHKE